MNTRPLPPIYEFLLWNNCNNNCKFCHQKDRRKRFPEKFPDNEGKALSIRLVRKFIEEISGEYNESGSNIINILFMGGELFDTDIGALADKEFQNLLQDIVWEMKVGRTQNVYVNSNLIYGKEGYKRLCRFLDTFDSVGFIDRVIFTTSSDIAYRFAGPGDLNRMTGNLLKLHEDYPTLNKTANCILTDEAVKFIAKTPEYIERFESRYHTRLNLIPYIKLKGVKAPQRGQVRELLLKLEETYPGYINTYVDNLTVNQGKRLFEFNGTKLVPVTAKNAECGHSENFRLTYDESEWKNGMKPYCFICDCIAMKNSLS